jgi:hypothetical protein
MEACLLILLLKTRAATFANVRITPIKYSWAKWFHQTSAIREFTAGL